MKNLLLATVMAFTAGMAQSASIFTLTDIDGNHEAYYLGDVQHGDADYLRTLLDENPDISVINMISPGGVASEGYELASVLSDYNMTAYVPEGRYCLSACATAFIGAAEYDIDGALGFHNAWAPGYDRFSTYNEGLQDGQSLGTRNTYHMLANGFGIQLPLLVGDLTGPETFLVFFHENDLMTLFARSDEDSVTPYLSALVDTNETWLDFHLMTPDRMFAYMGYE